MPTRPGAPSNSKVWTMSVLGSTVWNTPRNPYASPPVPRPTYCQRPPLGVPRPGHQAGLLEHLDVLRHGLLRDREGCREFVDRGIAAGEPRHDRAPHRIGQGHEGPVERVGVQILTRIQPLSLSTN